MSEKIRAFKGMDKNMQCRGFQFEIGKTYTTDTVELCKSGFHACEHPMDVFHYYMPHESRFFEVELGGEICRGYDDTKVAASEITILREVGFREMVNAAVKHAAKRTKKNSSRSARDNGAASATGHYCVASATGDYGAASTTGYCGAASATGDHGAASATRDCGVASATGDYGVASAAGDCGVASATGSWGAASATGHYCGAASATGHCGAASATGYLGAASATGDGCVALAAGICSRAMGTKGNAICCVERAPFNGVTFPILAIKAAIVDGETIKENVWYELHNGDFVEVQ